VGASAELENAAREFGKNFGIAFQIKDDILDYDGGDIGKPVGMDLLEQKMTLPLLGALEFCDDQKEKQVRSMVRDIPFHPENAEAIGSFVRERGGVSYAYERLKEYAEKAMRALTPFPDGRDKDFLKSLAGYLVYRDK